MNPLIQSITPAVNTYNLANVMQLLKSGNLEQIAANMMQQNPQFKAFVEANKGKTPDQVAKEHGVNLNEILRRYR